MSSSVNAIWAEWKKTTQFIESSRIAFSRETKLCSSFEALDPGSIQIVVQEGPSTFRSTFAQHVQTLKDESILFSLGLLASYALAESFARSKLVIPEDTELPGGIEGWGQALLQQTNHTWTDVLGGLEGLIEVSVARNYVAHGTSIVTERAIKRFTSRGLQSPWQLGNSLKMDYSTLDSYRARLRSLMRFGSNKRRKP